MRPSQLRPETLQEPRQGQDLQLYCFVESIELTVELIGDLDNPTHRETMY